MIALAVEYAPIAILLPEPGAAVSARSLRTGHDLQLN
jgi:hypothetical protein